MHAGRRRRHARCAAAAALTALVLAGACAGESPIDELGPSPGDTDTPGGLDGGGPVTEEMLRFYESPGVRDSGTAGELLDDEPIEVDDDLDAEGHRIVYASTTPRDDIVHVTGVVLVPEGRRPPAGWPVAVWGHPTVGVATRCAPSLEVPFGIEGAQTLLDAGFIVAAPDYDGLGSDGVHPYLVGESEGRTMLDIARAAAELGGADVVVAWGHSQGGHAALWARAIADDYAPELQLEATAAAAPPTDLAAFLDPGFTTNQLLLSVTAQTALAWRVVYPDAGLDALATDATLSAAADALQTCIIDLTAAAAAVQPEQVWALGPEAVPGWWALTELNSVDPDRGRGPVFLSHGRADELVPLAGSEELAEGLCAAGETVVTRFGETMTHGGAYADPEVQAEMLDWLIAAARGDVSASEC